MSIFVELNGLVTRVIARHVTFSTIDAHVRINQCNDVLLVVFYVLPKVYYLSSIADKKKLGNMKK